MCFFLARVSPKGDPGWRERLPGGVDFFPAGSVPVI